jgi:hypothetical protein
MARAVAPWLKFYPSDWAGDRKLRATGLAARGLWIECICVMHEADPYGHLLLNGNPVTDAQLAAMAGTDASTASTLLLELETMGVLSRRRDGVIYSRRMTRDAKKAATARKNGKSGGNPNLGKDRDIPPSDNPPDKPEVKPHIPDARDQITKLPTSSPLPGARGARLLPITDAFQPSEADRQAVRKARPDLSESDLERRTREFIDWNISKANTSADWGRDWRRWIVNTRGVGSAEPAQATDWNRVCEQFKRTGIWASYAGNRPGVPGCSCPREILAKHGLLEAA